MMWTTHGAARRIGTLGLNFILSGGLLPVPSERAGVDRADGVALAVERMVAAPAGREEDPAAEAEAEVEAEVDVEVEVEGLTSGWEVEAAGFLGGMLRWIQVSC